MSISMQEYFTKTVDYLRQQEERCGIPTPGCSADDFSCLYLRNDGNRCAVGYWIPDGHPAARSSTDVSGLASTYPELEGVAWPAEHGVRSGLNLARKLQCLHDMSLYRNDSGGGLSKEGESQAKCIAEEFHLVYTPPPTRQKAVKQ